MTDKYLKISVVIPVYNAGKYIEDCILSCFNQKAVEAKIEVIAIDDSSSDNSIEILNNLKGKFPGLIVVSMQNNLGPAAARNKGLNIATGDYIAFMDADDKMDPDKLNVQMDYFNSNHEVDLLLTGLEEVDESGDHIRFFYQYFPAFKKDQRKALFKDEISSVTPTILMRRKVFEKVGFFNENLLHFEDKEFLMRVLSTNRVEYIPKPLTIRRVLKASFSNTVDEQLFLDSRNKFLESVLKLYPELKPLQAEFWKKQYFGLGKIFQKRGEVCKARKYYLKSMKSSMHYKSVLGFLLTYFPKRIQQSLSAKRF